MVLKKPDEPLNLLNVNLTLMKKITQFIKEAIKELGKVTWPSKNTVLRLTLGVLVVSVIFAAFVGLVDVGITKGLEGLLSWANQGSYSTDTSIPQSIDISPDDIQVETSPVE